MITYKYDRLYEGVGEDQNAKDTEFSEYKKGVIKAIREVFREDLMSSTTAMPGEPEAQVAPEWKTGKQNIIHGTPPERKPLPRGGRAALTHYQFMAQLQSALNRDFRPRSIVIHPAVNNEYRVVMRRVNNRYNTYLYIPLNAIHSSSLDDNGKVLIDLAQSATLEENPGQNRVKTTPYVNYMEPPQPQGLIESYTYKKQEVSTWTPLAESESDFVITE